jgi:folate-binding protein YgfZ
MTRTPLHDVMSAAGARFGQFGGAETAADFGDVAKEYAVLRSGAAIYDLGRRAKILVTGNDRTRWLSGMVTNNIRDLAVNHGTYNFLLNAQGHILADMYIYNRGEYLLVDTDLDQLARVMELFDKYIIMDEVETTDASEKLSALGLGGPNAKSVLAKLALPVPAEPLTVADAEWQNVGVSIVRMDNDAFEIWIGAVHVATLWSALVAAGAVPVGYEMLEFARIAAGIPRFGVDIRDKDLPQETAQDRALNFNKGCYLGQEIVERIHARGAVHRTLAGFAVTQGAPAAGAKITVGGKEVGQVTSVAQLPSGSHRTLALGYVRREAAAPGTEVEIEGAKARVSSLPFPESERSHG